ncbi:FAD-dependent oxidoreductase [Streptomyces sp. W16]|nr:FAD-dependent oxidoreductase [Streptomyces sp. W16]MDV9168676.1 FAD-dependent oxidoreductase [Streptomyces sp. W16]
MVGGAGLVGAACALYAARAGLDVVIVDRGPVPGGTTGAGEGNLLVSDKEPGPEVGLALLSAHLPDHLPAIGPDPRTPGLVHACEHEGAGIGLATGTGHLIAQLPGGKTPDLDMAPFRPDRFQDDEQGE